VSYGQRINPYTDSFNFTVYEFKEGQKIEELEDDDAYYDPDETGTTSDGKQKNVYLKFGPADLYQVHDGKLFFKNAEAQCVIEVQSFKRHDLEQLMKF
jgi:hypothetical protein